MSKKLYRKSDENRSVAAVLASSQLPKEPYRSPWRRDYARVIHSAAFRRLQGKTQLFPNQESDFFRNRLTHSLEVAQVGKSIATRINETHKNFKTQKINLDIVETAALCHDLGHAPFGHNGEEALDECMKKDGGFEGNAQTLRILAKLEKRQTLQTAGDKPIPVDSAGNDCRAGLNLTNRTLASVLKYDKEIPQLFADRATPELQKGYYRTERNLVSRIKEGVLGNPNFKSEFKTIECAIMDIADDIAYSTYDIEDAFKANFLSPITLISASDDLLHAVAEKVEKGLKKHPLNLPASQTIFAPRDVLDTLLVLFAEVLDLTHLGIEPSSPIELTKLLRASVASTVFNSSKELCQNGYLRTEFTSHLVGRFIRGVEVTVNDDYRPLSKAYLNAETFKEVEVLKHFAYQTLIMSPMLKVVAYRGKDIIREIFDALESNQGNLLMPEDFRTLYQSLDEASDKKRTVCDFIAGMTDKYALEFHGRLFSTEPESIFRPI